MANITTKTFTTADTLISELNKYNIKNIKTIFANKTITAWNDFLNSFKKTPLNEQETNNAFLKLCNDLSQLQNSGLDVNDHELVYFIKRGKSLTSMAHWTAPFRVAKNHGYSIVPTFYEVYDNEDFSYEEKRDNNNKPFYNITFKVSEFDRSITKEKLIDKKFKGFALKLNISKILKDGSVDFLFETITVMTTDEILKRAEISSDGLFLKNWNDVSKKFATVLKDGIPVVSSKETIWSTQTKAMVQKTIVREATRLLKESLPFLSKMYEFMEFEDQQENPNLMEKAENTIDGEIVIQDIDLLNPPEDIKNKANEMIELYLANPTLADTQLEDILIKLREFFKIKNEENFVKEKLTPYKNSNAVSIVALLNYEKTKETILKALKVFEGENEISK